MSIVILIVEIGDPKWIDFLDRLDEDLRLGDGILRVLIRAVFVQFALGPVEPVVPIDVSADFAAVVIGVDPFRLVSGRSVRINVEPVTKIAVPDAVRVRPRHHVEGEFRQQFFDLLAAGRDSIEQVQESLAAGRLVRVLFSHEEDVGLALANGREEEVAILVRFASGFDRDPAIALSFDPRERADEFVVVVERLDH